MGKTKDLTLRLFDDPGSVDTFTGDGLALLPAYF